MVSEGLLSHTGFDASPPPLWLSALDAILAGTAGGRGQGLADAAAALLRPSVGTGSVHACAVELVRARCDSEAVERLRKVRVLILTLTLTLLLMLI